jgi:ribosomal-protein-alanine N-acetyltransferase
MIALVPACTAHGAVMAALHSSAFPPGERWGADAMSLQLCLPGAFATLALLPDATPGGFVLARVVADEAEILTLAVHPAQQRRGIANLLLHDAERRAERDGARSMFLEVAKPNTGARSLYTARGYLQVGTRRGYYAGGVDALVLRRALGEITPDAATAC